MAVEPAVTGESLLGLEDRERLLRLMLLMRSLEERAMSRPVVMMEPDGEEAIAIRSMTVLGLSWDHRALDGALAAQFLAALGARVEQRAA